MAEVKIKIATEIGESLNALNKETRSVKTLGDALVHTKKNTKAFTAAQNAFFKGINRDLQKAFDLAGGGLKGYEAELKVLEKYETNLRLGVGKTSETYKKYSAAIDNVRANIDKIKTANKAATEAQEAHNEVLRELSLYIQEVDHQVKSLNAQNAELGVMVLDNNELGLAKHTLQQYEASLKKIIADTGIYSVETQKAYKKVSDQRAVIGDIVEKEAQELEYKRALVQLDAELVNSMKSRAQTQAQLNAQNANVGFMMVTGDELGVANYALQQYETTLKETIAATGVNSQATQKAYEKYAEQKTVVDQLAASQANLSKASGNASLKLLSVAKNILKFQLLMAPITAVVRGFRNTLSDSVKVAAEAEQIFSKLSTVFDGFSDSAKKMASGLASSIGVANSTAASALSTVGDLLQAQGMGTGESLSTASEWVKQFQDIIAFKDINMSLEEFAQNFMSGAAGNLRNFRTFGSIVKESAVNAELARKGLDKLTGSELELAKMTTRAEMALSQQKNAMGATEREWDTMLSVNRRYTEAQKQFKENLGDELNKTLKPMRTTLTEILDAWNKIVDARKRYEGIKAGETSPIPEYDESIASQRMMLQQLLIENRTATLQGYTPRYSITGETVSMVSAATGATSEQILDAFEKMGSIDSDSYDRDKTLKEATEKLAEIARQEETRTRIEDRLSNITSITQGADSFIEAIASITGARGGMDIQDTSWLSVKKWYVNGEDQASSWIKEYVNGNIKGAFESIDSAELKSFGDLISGELGDLNDGDLLKNKAEAYRQFFEAVHNYFGKDGDYSEEELATLENIKKAYKDTNEEAKKYQERLEAEAGIQSHIGNFNDVLWEASTRQRLTGDGVSSDQMSIWIKYEKALEELDKQFKEIGKDTIELNGETYTQAQAIDKLKEARKAELDAIKKEEEELSKLEKFIKNLTNEGFSSGFTSALQGSSIFGLVKAGMEGAENAKKDLTVKDYAMGKDFDAGLYGAVTGVLSELVAQTEVFKEVLDIVKPIVETFNNFLKPIVPLVQIISFLINQLVFTLLKPLFPILKDVFTIIGHLAKPIQVALNVIHNIYAVVNNILQRLLHPFTGGDRMGYVSLDKGLDKIQASIDAIKNLTFDIKENTDPNNSELLKAYYNMFHNGMITASEYQGLLSNLNGVNYDNMRTYEGGAWQNRGGMTIVYNGDLKFEINGTNLSAEQIAEAVTRRQRELAVTGQYATA